MSYMIKFYMLMNHTFVPRMCLLCVLFTHSLPSTYLSQSISLDGSSVYVQVILVLLKSLQHKNSCAGNFIIYYCNSPIIVVINLLLYLIHKSNFIISIIYSIQYRKFMLCVISKFPGGLDVCLPLIMRDHSRC